MDHRDKVKIRRLIYSRITLLILALVFVAILKGSINVYKKQKLSRDTLRKADSELLELRERQEFLNEEIDSLNTKDGVEATLRERFGVAKEGEGVIILLDEEEVEEEQEIEKLGLWAEFRSLFGGGE